MFLNCSRSLPTLLFRNSTRCLSRFPQINVSTEPSMFDEDIHFSLAGLPPSKVVTIYATTRITKDCFYESFANYKVSDIGEVIVSKDECLRGTYSGVEPMGLIWSMIPFSEARKQSKRFLKTDVTKPQIYHFQVFDEEKRSLEECRSTEQSKSIVSTLVNRWFLAPGVRRIPVRENGVVGTLFLPPGKGPFPGLINLFGGYPGLLEYKSALHASHGFASLALAYVGLDGLPSTTLKTLDLEYFERSINFMKENKHIQGEKDIGVVAICKGAMLALAMATYLKGIRCVVSVNGFPMSSFGTLKYKEKHWDIDAMDYSKIVMNEDNILVDYFTFREGHVLEDHPNFFAFHKQHHVSYMFATSMDDECIPPFFIHKMQRLLEEEQHPDFEIHNYEKAGHLIEPPNFPFVYSFCQDKGSSILYIVNGGKLAPHCKAQHDCWTKMMKFLNKQMSDHPKNLVSRI